MVVTKTTFKPYIPPYVCELIQFLFYANRIGCGGYFQEIGSSARDRGIQGSNKQRYDLSIFFFFFGLGVT